ncbi:MAG: SRPBCC family protein [Chloroflexi bacterium]|nr:SRPBCC family protein [Chloroflexota bacterium]
MSTNSESFKLEFASDTEIVFTRRLAAPRKLVFEVMTDARHFKNWYGPRVMTVTHAESDARVGGKWRIVSFSPEHGEHAFSGEILEFDPHERVVQTEVYEPMPQFQNINTLLLDEANGVTTVRGHVQYQSKEHRDGHYNSGMEWGMRETYDRLEELVEALAQPS